MLICIADMPSCMLYRTLLAPSCAAPTLPSAPKLQQTNSSPDLFCNLLCNFDGSLSLYTIPPQMMTCPFNFSGLRIVNYLTFTFTFLFVLTGIRITTTFTCGRVGTCHAVLWRLVDCSRQKDLGCHSSRDYFLGIFRFFDFNRLPSKLAMTLVVPSLSLMCVFLPAFWPSSAQSLVLSACEA